MLWARCLSRLIPLLSSLVCVCAPCRQLSSVMSCVFPGANPPSQPFARCCRPLSSCLFAQACRAARVRLVLSAFECPCPMLLRRSVYIRTFPPPMLSPFSRARPRLCLPFFSVCLLPRCVVCNLSRQCVGMYCLDLVRTVSRPCLYLVYTLPKTRLDRV